jgi:hypothetical protein
MARTMGLVMGLVRKKEAKKRIKGNCCCTELFCVF